MNNILDFIPLLNLLFAIANGESRRWRWAVLWAYNFLVAVLEGWVWWILIGI